MTSDQVAASVNTNPVIIRRSLGDLRRATLVEVRRGAAAGWSLAREPREITLLDVYDAVEHEPMFAMHRTEPNLECPVGHGIRPALGQVYHEVDQALRRELTRTSIADMVRSTLAVP
jgi:DNA-binding IscR family transcriptional regulator